MQNQQNVKLTWLNDEPPSTAVYVYGEIDGEIRFEDVIILIPETRNSSIETFKVRASNIMKGCGVSEMLWYVVKSGNPFKIFKTELLNEFS